MQLPNWTFSLILLFSANYAAAEITVFDAATSIKTPVMLKAFTSGRFFPEGGKVVEFSLEGEKVATTLSGGDGYAFMKLIPYGSGVKTVKTKSGNDADEGTILVTDKNDRIIIIEIESVLMESPYTLKPLEGAKDAVQELSGNFRIIYFTSSIGAKKIKLWRKENSFPAFPVLNWNDAALLPALREQGINIDAVIASPNVLSQTPEIINRFSFEETESGTTATDWKDLLNTLKRIN